MEVSLPNTSTLPSNVVYKQTIGVIFFRVVTMVIVGMLLGGMIVFVMQKTSYNRIVVFNQPTSTVVRITSVRLEKPGFVGISVERDGGWVVVGSSLYLEPGNYQNLVIDIGILNPINVLDKDKTSGNFVPHNFIARLYEDRGVPYMFDANMADEPVRDAQGVIYQKHFWAKTEGNDMYAFMMWFISNPLENAIDLLFPY